MGKYKKVGDSVFITEIDECFSVIGKPDVAKNPITGKVERILDIAITDKKTYCPKCKKENDPGIEVTMLESGLYVYPCKRCNQFVWFRDKNDENEKKKIC